MTTQVSFHADFDGTVRAETTGTVGAPFTLIFRGSDGERVGSATFYTGDADYTRRLIEAVNAVAPPETKQVGAASAA